jgi:hypothetical protein
MGKGPIRITPPMLPDPPKVIEAINITNSPTRTKVMPKNKSHRVLFEISEPASSYSLVSILATSSTNILQ